MTIGRNQGQLAFLEQYQGSVQRVPWVLGGDREHDPLDHSIQRLSGKLDPLVHLDLGERRKLVSGLTGDAVARPFT